MAWDRCRGAAESTQAARQDRRRGVERVLSLAEHLAPSDRALLEQIFRHGQRVNDLALACGRPVDQLRRRVRKLMARIREPQFVQAVELGRLLPDDLQEIVRRVVLQGQSVRSTAVSMRIPHHALRMRLAVARGMLQTLDRTIRMGVRPSDSEPLAA